MIGNLFRPLTRCTTYGLSNSYALSRKARRGFSLVSVHSYFPASLLRLQQQRNSGLFDCKGSENAAPLDGVLVSEDGLVYPRVSMSWPHSNGAMFMPNTFTMQGLIRMSLDKYLEDAESGEVLEEPMIYSAKKGTPIPSELTLLRQHSSHFSLQPSTPVPLKELNDLLNDFYLRNAVADTVEKWLSSHQFEDALADDADVDWMRI